MYGMDAPAARFETAAGVHLRRLSPKDPMPTPQKLAAVIACGVALLQFGPAHAVAVVTYTGFASADSFGLNRVQQSAGATTGDPASYAVNAAGNIASSVSDSANGGSVLATSTSAGGTFDDGSLYGGAAGASTSLSYRVMLVGPDVPGTVPVHIVANGSVTGTGSTQASVSFVLNYNNGDALLIAGATLNSFTGNSFVFDKVERFRPNSFFDVYLSADSGSGGVGVGVGSSQAFADPSFTIDDPAYASLYRLEGIPGQVPSVPEPSAWGLALLGLGVLGAARARQARGKAVGA